LLAGVLVEAGDFLDAHPGCCQPVGHAFVAEHIHIGEDLTETAAGRRAHALKGVCHQHKSWLQLSLYAIQIDLAVLDAADDLELCDYVRERGQEARELTAWLSDETSGAFFAARPKGEHVGPHRRADGKERQVGQSVESVV
jgi:hypothetical protein